MTGAWCGFGFGFAPRRAQACACERARERARAGRTSGSGVATTRRAASDARPEAKARGSVRLDAGGCAAGGREARGARRAAATAMSQAECVFGAQFKDFVILAADKTQTFSIIVQKTDEDKISVMDDNKLLACVGVTGDR